MPAVWLMVAALLLVAFQLVPLPPALWTGLPGRENATAVSQLIGRGDAWRPLSLDPEATRRAGAALLLPFAILLAIVGGSHRGLILIVRTIVVAALISALLGALQITFGAPQQLAPYGGLEEGVATGLFANPNHQAQLLLAGLVATALLIRIGRPHMRIRKPGRDLRLHMGWLLMPVFVVMNFAAQTRAGLVLLAPAMAAAAALAIKRQWTTRLFALFVAGAVAIGTAMLMPGWIERTLQLSTTELGEYRVLNFPDIMFTLRQFWPWGSGLGTFVPLFMANENLDLVSRHYLNHAHNDLAELLIETGLPGALLVAGFLLLVGWRLWKLRRRSGGSAERGPALTGFAILLLLALQSLFDYPLRTDALAALGAAALGLFLSTARREVTVVSGDAPTREGRRGFASGRTGGRRSAGGRDR